MVVVKKRAPSTTSPPRMALLRLQLKPVAQTAPLIDGASWPRSLDLEAELPALLSALAGRLGNIALVVYQLGAWNQAPRELDVVGTPVQLEGLASTGPPTLEVFGLGGSRLTLLIVPPDATATNAQQQLMAASDLGHSDADVVGATARALEEVVMLLARHEGNQTRRRTEQIGGWVHESAEQFADAPV